MPNHLLEPLNLDPQVDEGLRKATRNRRTVLLSLAVLVVVWLLATGAGGLIVFSSERVPIPGTYNDVDQTEDCDLTRLVTVSFAGREHRFALWTSRVRAMPIVRWAE
jgi:hypothetical protein